MLYIVDAVPILVYILSNNIRAKIFLLNFSFFFFFFLVFLLCGWWCIFPHPNSYGIKNAFFHLSHTHFSMFFIPLSFSTSFCLVIQFLHNFGLIATMYSVWFIHRLFLKWFFKVFIVRRMSAGWIFLLLLFTYKCRTLALIEWLLWKSFFFFWINVRAHLNTISRLKILLNLVTKSWDFDTSIEKNFHRRFGAHVLCYHTRPASSNDNLRIELHSMCYVTERL